jgi:hypothetical protein
MNTKHSALKSIAILLVLSVAQVYVLASPNRALFGRLVTNSDSFVVVNGNDALTGTTILSGAHLQTPAGVAATVQMDSLGRVEMAPGTALTLSFSKGNVAVDVSSGQALLVTPKGVNGSVKTPDGKVERSDPAKESSELGSTAPQGGNSDDANDGPSFGEVLAYGLPIMGGAIVAAVYVPCRRGRNPSPGTPQGPKQGCDRGL